MRSLSQDAIGKIAGTYFQDQAVIERRKGVSAEEIVLWEVIATLPARMEDKGTALFAKDSFSGNYDCTVTCVGALTMNEPNDAYRVTVKVFKSEYELGEDDSRDEPVLKRERVLSIVDVEGAREAAGQDVFVILRCEDGAPDAR